MYPYDKCSFCLFSVDSLLIYEPSYGVDDPMTSLSLAAEDMDVLLYSSAWQSTDSAGINGRWNYTSMTSSLVVKLSSTLSAYEVPQYDDMSSATICRRLVSVRFHVIGESEAIIVLSAMSWVLQHRHDVILMSTLDFTEEIGITISNLA
jgi:hypothetical protein